MSLWDASDPSNPTVVGTVTAPGSPDSSSDALSPYFSQDGRLGAFADVPQSTLTVFDVATGRQLWTREVHNMTQVAFSPDAHTLAVEAVPTVTLYDAATGAPGRSFAVAGSGAIGLEYVRNGTALATSSELAASALGTTSGGAGVQLWDATTLEPIGVPLPLAVVGNFYIARSADGSRMLAGTTAGKAVVWDLDVEHWEEVACRLSGRNLTKAEWTRYVPNRAYAVTCPQWPAGN
jgi:WD40 repeat protein